MRLAILQCICWMGILQVTAIPLNKTELTGDDDDQSLAEEYANLKHILIYNYGYSTDFADLVEINLKRAVREEKQRQRQQHLESPDRQRQQQVQVSEEDYEDESTLPPGPTTPGASPGDVVRGVAGIITSLGTFNYGNFWQSFVSFFPPGQREGAQALVDASLGRRPAKWPTIPTTTTKLTTTTKDEDEIDSEETTRAAVTAAGTATTLAPGAVSGTAGSAAVTPAVTGAPSVVALAAATEPVIASPTTKYMVRHRTATSIPYNVENVEIPIGTLRSSDNLLEDGETTTLSASSTSLIS